MKRTLTITVFFIVFLLVYFLQTNLFCWYNIAGVEPNVFILLMLFIGLFSGRTYGFVIGIIFGLFLDFFIGKRIGFNGILIGITGIIGGLLSKNYSNGSRLTFIVITAIVTVFIETINSIMQVIIIHSQIIFINYIQIVIIEAIYNSILSIILYPLIQKMGNIVHKVFSEKTNLFMKIY